MSSPSHHSQHQKLTTYPFHLTLREEKLPVFKEFDDLVRQTHNPVEVDKLMYILIRTPCMILDEILYIFLQYPSLLHIHCEYVMNDEQDNNELAFYFVFFERKYLVCDYQDMYLLLARQHEYEAAIENDHLEDFIAECQKLNVTEKYIDFVGVINMDDDAFETAYANISAFNGDIDAFLHANFSKNPRNGYVSNDFARLEDHDAFIADISGIDFDTDSYSGTDPDILAKIIEDVVIDSHIENDEMTIDDA